MNMSAMRTSHYNLIGKGGLDPFLFSIEKAITINLVIVAKLTDLI
jgi:hypothetical protein